MSKTIVQEFTKSEVKVLNAKGHNKSLLEWAGMIDTNIFLLDNLLVVQKVQL